ncbi:HD domain-containing protein [Streptomyces meridianus]|uniref:HD domain-containing protein n=1 Tax=Streptomyces meridianus TaxID=2938945 RepID=A0ABT0X888_9ACTN|nr:HD domain-containing protein [Streptomyces meridianus]MCM2577937.1 HD domain-containing protein [Streptomyces meridianus]
MPFADVDALAAAAHAGQTDKIGVPYVEHVRAVARGLVPVSERLAMAGLLHDVVEDTGWTCAGLLEAGVPADVVALVDAVTKRPGVPYPDMLRAIAADPDAALLKIADNAHNSRPDRLAALPADGRERLAEKYRAARDVLWPAVDRGRLETVVRSVNPSLLETGSG